MSYAPIMWSPGMTLEALEEMVINHALKFYQGNKTTTAASLGIAIRTLDNKLEKYAAVRTTLENIREDGRIRKEIYLLRARGHEIPQELLEAQARLRVEPAQKLPAQQSVSMQEREEVQEVLLERPTRGRPRKTGSGF